MSRLTALKAVIEQGSITNVVLRGDMETYPEPPYVIIFDDYALNSYYMLDNTVDPFVVEACFPVGWSEKCTKYVNQELMTMLNKKVITDAEDGTVFQVYSTANITPLIEPNDDRALSKGNDDGTLSKQRRFFTPRRGL